MNDRLVLVDGVCLAVQRTLASVLSSFTGTELWLENDLANLLSVFDSKKAIRTDAAASLLRIYSDLDIYNFQIGRNVNFRAQDPSSAQSNGLEERYRSRLLAKDGEEAVEALKRGRPLLVYTVKWLWRADLLWEAWGDRIEAYYFVLAHPARVVEEVLSDGGIDLSLDRKLNSVLERYQTIVDSLDSKDPRVETLFFEHFEKGPHRYINRFLNQLRVERTEKTAEILRSLIPQHGKSSFRGLQPKIMKDLSDHSCTASTRNKFLEAVRAYESRHVR